MNRLNKQLVVVVSLVLCLFAANALAQHQTSGNIGVSVEEGKALGNGWSIKKDIMDQDVYNDNNDKIGTIEDIIVTQDKATSYAIIGVGGFLGMGKHDVAIPVNHFKINNKRILLPGATKDALKNMPEFKYNR